jgi:exopolyphosphatase/guanosine-5'-triphosphate,3'-diphosphate pyrophosphatase
VENLAHRFRSDDAHVRHVAALSLEIFDGLASAGLHDYDRPERELLWAACHLHDIGTAIDYDDHHRHSHYLVLNAGLPGFTPRELILIGLTARYHRKGEPTIAELGALSERGDGERLKLLCGVIRLAEQLERSRDQTIAAVHVDRRNGTICLRAQTRPGADASLPIWAARRNAQLLGQALGGLVVEVDAAK